MDLVVNTVMSQALQAFNTEALGVCLFWVFLGASSAKLFIEMIEKTFDMFKDPHNKHPLFTGGVIALNSLFTIGNYYFAQWAWTNISNSCPNLLADNQQPESTE